MKINVAPNLQLVRFDAPSTPASQAAAETTERPNNHIYVLDRSGSMSGCIRDLIEDVIVRAKSLPKGDTISVAWFSGNGQYDFILKGATIDTNLDSIAALLRRYASTVGLTTFSQILDKLDSAIGDLSALNSTFSLTFLTDGNPVVDDYTAEMIAIDRAIDAVKGKLASVMIVGYGDYYNRDVLSAMARRFGGSMVHASNRADYVAHFATFAETVAETCGRVDIAIPDHDKVLALFCLNGNTVVTFQPAGSVSVPVPRRGKAAVYAVVQGPSKSGCEFCDSDKVAVRAFYAASLALTQAGKVDIALDFVSALGDVAIANALNNSFTNEEYGAAEAKVRAAIKSPSGRLVGGKKVGCVPDRNAFCVVDLIDALVDDDAQLAVNDPAFQYRRIGLKSVNTSTVEFKRDTAATVPIASITWNDCLLNLSCLVQVPGTVTLDEAAAKFGFAANYPTYVWRSYAIVKDGAVNVRALPVLISERLHQNLMARGLVSSPWIPKTPSVIDLSGLPVMNRGMADGNLSAVQLATSALTELRLEAELKILRAVRKQLEAEGATFKPTTALTEAQGAYLEKFHIGANGFSPPSEPVAPTDAYEVNRFALKIGSMSTLPTLAAAKEKQAKVEAWAKANGRGREPKLTRSEEFVLEAEGRLKADVKMDRLPDVISAIDTRSTTLRKLRRQIQRTKFAVLLGKRWFTEFKSLDENTLDANGYTFTFDISKARVDI